MAEKKGVGHAYNVDFLNVVFAASSLFLFLSVIWMVWDDFNRDWKNTQREFARLELDVTRASSQQANGARDAPKLRQLGAARTAARKSEAANRQKIDELEGKLADIDARLYRETQDYQFAKATYDSDRYIFEAQRAAGDSRAAGREKEVTDLGERVSDLNLIVEKTTAERAVISKELDTFTGERTDDSEADRRDQRRLQPAADPGQRAGAERRQRLLPQCAAARLHGADHPGEPDHPAQCGG